MIKSEERYQCYVQILKDELVPAMGCTEPIAIAYAAAKAREVLGNLPERVELEVSGNIIKNVKSVIVPHTGGMRGIAAAAAAGIIAGDASKELQVLAHVTKEQEAQMKEYEQQTPMKIIYSDNPAIFYLGVHCYYKDSHSFVEIKDRHRNIVRIEKDGEVLFDKSQETATEEELQAASGVCDHIKKLSEDRSCLTIAQIIDFAKTVDIEDVKETLDRQIECNMAISAEGLRGNYGANVGKVLLKHYPDDIKTRAKASAAAGSDARMNGCEMPVVINSGSGNQGMTTSIPVIVYARELGKTQEELYRALVVSNLVTIHLKTGVGRLSAYCGAVSAGCGCGAGIAFLLGGGEVEVSHTVVNALAMISGTVCDGAKASCAAKIAAAVEAGILGYYMYVEGQEFVGGDGLVLKGVENTIANFGKLASIGMAGTDKEIIRLMIGE